MILSIPQGAECYAIRYTCCHGSTKEMISGFKLSLSLSVLFALLAF